MSTDLDYDIEKPTIKDDKWFIFKNAIFSQLESADCNDAIEGQCYNDKTFNQCVDMCNDNPNCNMGYYISNLNSPNICVPLQQPKKFLNPSYRLRNKRIYKELNNATTKTFINKEIFPFPPEQANTVFYMDNFNIQNVETGLFLESSPLSTNNSNVLFSKDGDLQVQLLEIPPNFAEGVQYISVKYGDKLAFNIPRTTLVLRESINNIPRMEWISRTASLSEDLAFMIEPTMPGKKIGDNVSYSDTFGIKSDVSILGVDFASHMERSYYSTYSKAKELNKAITFRFIPQMIGYYCNNDNQCTPVPLTKMIVDKNGIGTYDGLAIGRNPGCWGVCKYKVQNQPHLHPFDIYNNDDDNVNNVTNSHWKTIVIIVISIFLVLFIVYKISR